MKKTLTIILALVLALGVLAGCGSSASTPSASEAPATEAPADASEAPAALTPLVVGASSTPHAEILESVKDVFAAEGYDLQVVVYDDYVLPNTALADGELDANYFQHTPYLNSFNASNGTDLVSAAKIHYEPFGIYGNGVSDLSELQPGATIIIPADDSNETRALLLLQPMTRAPRRASTTSTSLTTAATMSLPFRPIPFPPSSPTATPAPSQSSTATTRFRPA